MTDRYEPDNSKRPKNLLVAAPKLLDACENILRSVGQGNLPNSEHINGKWLTKIIRDAVILARQPRPTMKSYSFRLPDTLVEDFRAVTAPEDISKAVRRIMTEYVEKNAKKLKDVKG